MPLPSATKVGTTPSTTTTSIPSAFFQALVSHAVSQAPSLEPYTYTANKKKESKSSYTYPFVKKYQDALLASHTGDASGIRLVIGTKYIYPVLQQCDSLLSHNIEVSPSARVRLATMAFQHAAFRLVWLTRNPTWWATVYDLIYLSAVLLCEISIHDDTSTLTTGGGGSGSDPGSGGTRGGDFYHHLESEGFPNYANSIYIHEEETSSTSSSSIVVPPRPELVREVCSNHITSASTIIGDPVYVQWINQQSALSPSFKECVMIACAILSFAFPGISMYALVLIAMFIATNGKMTPFQGEGVSGPWVQWTYRPPPAPVPSAASSEKQHYFPDLIPRRDFRPHTYHAQLGVCVYTSYFNSIRTAAENARDAAINRSKHVLGQWERLIVSGKWQRQRSDAIKCVMETVREWPNVFSIAFVYGEISRFLCLIAAEFYYMYFVKVRDDDGKDAAGTSRDPKGDAAGTSRDPVVIEDAPPPTTTSSRRTEKELQNVMISIFIATVLVSGAFAQLDLQRASERLQSAPARLNALFPTATTGATSSSGKPIQQGRSSTTPWKKNDVLTLCFLPILVANWCAKRARLPVSDPTVQTFRTGLRTQSEARFPVVFSSAKIALRVIEQLDTIITRIEHPLVVMLNQIRGRDLNQRVLYFNSKFVFQSVIVSTHVFQSVLQSVQNQDMDIGIILSEMVHRRITMGMDALEHTATWYVNQYSKHHPYHTLSHEKSDITCPPRTVLLTIASDFQGLCSARETAQEILNTELRM